MSYWQEIRVKSMTTETRLTLRKQLARDALSLGVSEAARRHGTTRPTARKWRDRYQAEGVRGLAELSRAPHRIPHKARPATEARLVALRSRYPGWGVDRLAVHFALGCSRTAAARILRQAGLTHRRKRKRVRNDLRAAKALLKPFEKIQIDAKTLSDIPAYARYMADQGLPGHLFSARDLRPGSSWFAFARTVDGWTSGLFAGYLFSHLAASGVDLSGTTVQVDNGSEFIGSARKLRGEPTLFEAVVEHYTGRRPRTIFPGAKTCQSDVEAFNRLVEDEFLAVEDLSSLPRLLGCARTYQTYFNHHRVLLWKGPHTPAQHLRSAQQEGHQPHASLRALTLPPLVLNDLPLPPPEPGYDLPDMVKSLPHLA